MKRGRSGRDGFSLVEVLVALAVAGLVVTAAGALTSTIQMVESRQARANAARENVIAADRLLRAVVEGAVPDLSQDRPEAEVGTARQATFVTQGPPVLAFDRPRPMTLAIDRNGDMARLLVRWRDPETGREREEEVFSGARALTLSYHSGAQGNVAGTWAATWSLPSRLPAGLLLRVDMPELGPPIDIVARTYSRLPNACVALPHEPRCADRRPVAAARND